MVSLETEFVNHLNRHIGLIYKVCKVYCQHPEDRRDLFQEIVLQLWKGYAGFRKEAQFSTWMYRVALNTAISNYRKKSRVPNSVLLPDLDFDVPDPADLTNNEQVRVLYQAIAQLTVVEKTMILLHLDGCTYLEIASIAGISQNNVGVKLNRIKSKLEKIVSVYGNSI